MLINYSLLFSTFIIIVITNFSTADNDNLQDFCPTATATPPPTSYNKQSIFINGFPCKSPSNTASEDFKSTRLNRQGNIHNIFQSSTILVTAAEYSGLNTLGLSLARIDLGEDGVISLHSHPRSSEMVFVETGIVTVGFLDTNNKVFQKDLKKGDVFVVPRGLLHYFFNAGFEVATVFSVFNSQNPGVVSFTGGFFGDNVEDPTMKFKKKTLEDMQKKNGDYEGDQPTDVGFDSEPRTGPEHHHSEL